MVNLNVIKMSPTFNTSNNNLISFCGLWSKELSIKVNKIVIVIELSFSLF